MAKKLRSKGDSSQGSKGSPGQAAPGDSRPAGTGGARSGTWTDEYGRTCYGDDCIQLAIDQARREVVVNVKPGAKCDLGPMIETLRETLGKGARTVYELESEVKES